MDKCKIVMYHYVRPIKKSHYPEIKGLEPSGFENQLLHFKKSFRFGNLSKILKSFRDKTNISKNQIILTFDDGLKDHYTTVFPILKKMNISAHFFPPSKPIEEKIVLDVHKIHFILANTENKQKIIQEIFSFIENNMQDDNLKSPNEYFKKLAIPNRFDSKEVIFIKRILQRELPLKLRNKITDLLFKKFVSDDEQSFSENLYMSMEEMKEMYESGMGFGSHSHSHEWLTTLSNSNLVNEINRSKKFCNSIGIRDELIMCYPYGDFNDNVINKISKQGFKAGLTTKVGDAKISDKEIFKLNRYDTNDFPQ